MAPYYGYLGMALQSIVASEPARFLVTSGLQLTNLVLCTMRVFALYNKNYYLLGVLATLIGVSVIIGTVRLSR
jgi:hypothetical protein